jgi:hypothetical protein
VLADTITLRDLYKKHHWQVSGPTFFQLHQLYDKHYEEQATLVDQIAERIQLLGGVSIAMAQDVADRTQIERPPAGWSAQQADRRRRVSCSALLGGGVAWPKQDEKAEEEGRQSKVDEQTSDER